MLAQLLGNAWKATSEVFFARIEVGAVRRASEVAFFVRDNGVGFEPAQAVRLFAPFTRVHHPGHEPKESLGLGLAIVARIVQRHGGRVWAEGERGRGATFWFTLPGVVEQRAAA